MQPPSNPMQLMLKRLVSSAVPTLVLGTLFAGWYASNIAFNIFNKQALLVFPNAATITFVHLAVASAVCAVAWSVRAFPYPQGAFRCPELMKSLAPLAALHAVGFLATNASLGSVQVSFTHTIKALEPFFAVVLSAVLVGKRPPSAVSVFALVPIVAGVIVASVTEVSFVWAGFLSALLSNMCFQSRNVLSKEFMEREAYDSLEGVKNESLTSKWREAYVRGRGVSRPCRSEVQVDDFALFALMSMGAAALIGPIALAIDGPGPALTLLGALPDAVANPHAAFSGSCDVAPYALARSVVAGACRTSDVLVSYAILSRVSPVTHSVGNCVKRVAVIIASMIFFQNPTTLANRLGTGLALLGVLLYSVTLAHAKRVSTRRKTRRVLNEEQKSVAKMKDRRAAMPTSAPIDMPPAKKVAEKGEDATDKAPGQGKEGVDAGWGI